MKHFIFFTRLSTYFFALVCFSSVGYASSPSAENNVHFCRVLNAEDLQDRDSLYVATLLWDMSGYVTPVVTIPRSPTPDFDGDGRRVGFSDFVLFGAHYGARQRDESYEAQYDLDSDGVIGFSDFVIFGNAYGTVVSSN